MLTEEMVNSKKSFFKFVWGKIFKLKQHIEILLSKNLKYYDIKLGEISFKFSFLNGKIDTVGKLLRTKSSWEPHCTTAIKTLIDKKDNILQLGMAWGYFSCLMKKIQSEQSKFYGVEKEGCESVENNFKINEFKNYELFKLTISNVTQNNNIKFIDLLKKIPDEINFLFTDIEGSEQFIIEDIIKYKIKIKKMIVGYHLIEEVPKKLQKDNYYKFFYTRDKLNKYLKELSENYEVRIDQDNIILKLMS